MAGPTPLRHDPALEKYNQLNKERWRYFRWTPRTAFISFMYAIFVPSVVGYAFAKTDVSPQASCGWSHGYNCDG
ncbi:hypothetical protein CLAIMM_10572 isoform 2 [Cladophialophora immunda]|nr:hypothetical protein CLAIMM_10572 isoform 2 [Cladophialophora immunda]